MFSNTCKYAIRAVIYLATRENIKEKIGIKKIADDLNLPSPFLGKILQNLVRAKILDSVKGPHGGFSMGKDPNDIAIIDIIDVIDGREIFENCLIGLKICESDPLKRSLCPFHPYSEPVRTRILELFEGQSVGSFAKNFEDVKSLVNL